MKIVIALPEHTTRPIGGYHVHYHYANLLSRRGHEVTIVFPRRVAELADTLRCRVEEPFWAAKRRLKHSPLITTFSLDDEVKVKLLRNFTAGALPDSDRLIATSWRTAEALAEAPPRCGRKYYIVYDYEYLMTAEPDERQRIERTYRLPFGIIVTSSVVAGEVRRCGGNPIAMIPCGLDFAEFATDVPAEQRQRLTVGFPVRGEPFKGTADAIAAVTILRDRYGDTVHAAAFGSHRYDLPPWVDWFQYPSQVELRRFYNQQSVFLLPSHYEGWGLPGVEAMACGAALVAADNGGCRDYAIDGVTALVVPSQQPKMLADAVGRLFDDDVARLKLAASGNDFVQRFTWKKAIDQLALVLEQTVGANV